MANQGKWTILEPSVIRDAVSGRLAFQSKFGTSYISGATSALCLKQNPVDGAENEGDATLYIGTTNGGVYMRHYDYQTNTWSDQWTWLSKPTGSSDGGYVGAQGIGALSISPDGKFIAVGRGNSSNYIGYTPSGPALQIGQILSDGSVDWLSVDPNMFLSGYVQNGNIRDVSWQHDALYISAANGYGVRAGGEFIRLSVDDTGSITNYTGLGSVDNNVVTSASAGPESPVFLSTIYGILQAVDPTTGSIVTVQGDIWEQVRQQRLNNNELLARICVAKNPELDGQYIVLMGWYYTVPEGEDKGKEFIAYVDRLTVTASNTITDVTSIDFSRKAGDNQASSLSFFGNYSLLFDPVDPTLNTVLVGGNTYSEKHPDGNAPYSVTGGFVRGNFATQSIEAIFGPYKDSGNALVADSLLIGAPHADSRKAVILQTRGGDEIIQSDDGGVWLLSSPTSEKPFRVWTSLNAVGLNALEVIASGWDARSNSFVSAFQDNAFSFGQLGDSYMNNIGAGDGSLSLMDGARIEDTEALSWAYQAPQQYMFNGLINAVAFNELGDIARSESLALVTNWQGSSVQPLTVVESLALLATGLDVKDVKSKSTFKGPATVNPYRQGDIILGGDSGLYETFVPNWSDTVKAAGYGTLGLVPVVPFSDAKTNFTAVDLGSSAAYVQAHKRDKPLFWDSLLAVSWDQRSRQSTIWYRDPVILDQAPASLADVNPEFLGRIALQQLTTSGYVINDIAHSVNQDGSLNSAYWIESGGSLSYQTPDAPPIQPTEGTDGAALVIYHAGTGITTRMPYRQDPGLKQLVLSTDHFGPTSLAILPGLEGQPDLLVIGGEHGLYASQLDAQGMPVGFEPMSIDGLSDGVQLGSAVTGLVYNEQDGILTASMLGGGTLLYSQTGDLLPTPSDSDSLKVSDTFVPRTLSESLDKRGNHVYGSFVIELPESGFDAQGVAQVQFVISNADLWRTNLESLSFYFQPGDSGTEKQFNLLSRDGSTIVETMEFYDNATIRVGLFTTKATAREMPTITLDYTVNLLDGDGKVVQTVDASLNLVPSGATPSFVRYKSPSPSESAETSVFQARFGSKAIEGELQMLPFSFKIGLPADLPEGSEVYAFKVIDINGTIVVDGKQFSPSDPDYLSKVLSQKIISPDKTPIVAGRAVGGAGLGVDVLTGLFFNGDNGQFLTSESVYYGKMMNSKMPDAFYNGTEVPPFLGIAVQYADGPLKTSTIDTTALKGNEISLSADASDRGFVVDVGYGGLFAAQVSEGDISVAKLGRLDSAFGFVRVDDLFGTIGELEPGEVGYAAAALERSISERLDLTLSQAYGSTKSYKMDGFVPGTYYGSYITPGYSNVADALNALHANSSESVAWFSFDKANATAQGSLVSAAIPFAADMIAFEDMPLSGDSDFNDLVAFYGSLV